MSRAAHALKAKRLKKNYVKNTKNASEDHLAKRIASEKQHQLLPQKVEKAHKRDAKCSLRMFFENLFGIPFFIFSLQTSLPVENTCKIKKK